MVMIIMYFGLAARLALIIKDKRYRDAAVDISKN